jgi:hypothetical protein
MKIIIKYLLITFFLFSSDSFARGKNQMMPEDFSQMSEKEFKNFKEAMEGALNDYQKLSPEEKQGLIDQMKSFGTPGIENLTIEELDKSMQETATMLEELEKSITSEKYEKNDITNSSSTEKKINTPKNQGDEKKLKSNIEKIEEVINSSTKTIGILSFKIQDEIIFHEFQSHWKSIKEDIEKMSYYLKVIKEFLSNNKEKTIFLEELKSLIPNFEHIASLQTQIESLISLEEYESKQKKTNLFQKYSIKNSPEKLKSFLENEIKIIKKDINELENKPKNRDTITKIKGLEYQLDILEKDLIESSIETESMYTDTIKIYKKTIEEVIKNISNTMINGVPKDTLIQKIEGIIKKYFPLEYEKGKEKLAIIKSQEAAIKKENSALKRSGSDLFLEKNFKSENFNDNNNRRDFIEEDSSNSFNYEQMERDERENKEMREEKMFELPQQEFPQNKEGKSNPLNNEKSEIKTGGESDITKTIKPKKKKKKKKKEGLINSQEEQKIQKATQEDQKTIKKIESQPTILTEILDSVIETIQEFIVQNPKSFNEINNKKLKASLESEFEKIPSLFKNIKEEEVPEELKEKKSIIEKYKDNKTADQPSFFQEELEKMSLLSLNKDTKITTMQNIFYQIKEISHILNKEFNSEQRLKDYNQLKNIIEQYTNLEKEYKTKFAEFDSSEKEKAYWLKSKSEIEKTIQDKKLKEEAVKEKK